MNLIAQLEAASKQAASMSEERRRQQEEWEARKRAGLSSRPTRLTDALRERLPKSPDDAMSLEQIRALVADVSHADTGLSATLTGLHRRGEVGRVGGVLNYKYFRKS